MGALGRVASKTGQWIKRNKGKTAVGGAALTYGAYELLNNDEQPQQQEEQTQSQPQQTQEQPKQTKSKSPSNQVAKEITKPIEKASDIDEGMKAILQLTTTLAPRVQAMQQEYQMLATKYLEANEVYQKKLDEIMPAMMLLVSKTPFNSLTKEDLPKIMGDYLKYMPYTQGVSNLDKLVKGYYVLRVNGVDTEGLSFEDIMMAAENPAFVSNMNEEVGQVLAQLGEIFKLKIKQNIDQIGVIRDMYEDKIKQHIEMAKLMEHSLTNIVKMMIDKEYKEKSLQLKAMQIAEQGRHNRAMEGLKAEDLNIKREKLKSGNSKKGGELLDDEELNY